MPAAIAATSAKKNPKVIGYGKFTYARKRPCRRLLRAHTLTSRAPSNAAPLDTNTPHGLEPVTDWYIPKTASGAAITRSPLRK